MGGKEEEMGRRKILDLVVHLVLALHLLVEEGVDIVPPGELDGGVRGGRSGVGGERARAADPAAVRWRLPACASAAFSFWWSIPGRVARVDMAGERI